MYSLKECIMNLTIVFFSENTETSDLNLCEEPCEKLSEVNMSTPITETYMVPYEEPFVTVEKLVYIINAYT